MRILLILLINFFYINTSFALSEIWKMGDQFLELERVEKSGELVSKSCLKKKCDAMKAMKKISFKNIDPGKFSGGKNPGAVLCHELKNAQIVFLRDLKGNDNSFCMFADKSFVSSGTLEMKARMNDEK